MVAMLEIVVLIACAVVGIWWFRRTSLYRARRGDPGQPGHHKLTGRADQNMSGPR
jgi:hypothetical protein